MARTKREGAEVMKPRGRPRKGADVRRLASIGFRPTPKLKQQLEGAAADNGRSVSQEIVSRLEASFLLESKSMNDWPEWMRAASKLEGTPPEGLK